MSKFQLDLIDLKGGDLELIEHILKSQAVNEVITGFLFAGVPVMTRFFSLKLGHAFDDLAWEILTIALANYPELHKFKGERASALEHVTFHINLIDLGYDGVNEQLLFKFKNPYVKIHPLGQQESVYHYDATIYAACQPDQSVKVLDSTRGVKPILLDHDHDIPWFYNRMPSLLKNRLAVSTIIVVDTDAYAHSRSK